MTRNKPNKYLNKFLILIWNLALPLAKDYILNDSTKNLKVLTESSLYYFETSVNPMSHANTYCTVQPVDPQGASKIHIAFGEMIAVNKYSVVVTENLAFK